MRARVHRDKRFVLALLLLLGIAAIFWGGSRYPQLSEKIAMGGSLALEDPLAFEALIPVDSSQSVPRRVLYSSINWLYTNQQGMTFGLLLAAAFMTLLPLLGSVAFRGVFPNTLLGVVMGAPLGVCVNCAAPIAQGLHASGARIETSIAAMISSPTLNAVVLAMLFALFPFHIAIAKLGLTLGFLLIAIPLLTRTVFARERLEASEAQRLGASRGLTAPVPPPGFELPGVDSANRWSAALAWVAGRFGRNLWFIAKVSLPLMLLAGLLGSLLVTVVPLHQVAGWLPGEGFFSISIALVAMALLGLALPVPIAFDVVLVGALFAGGLPGHYALVLLFTLGIFSVYSFAIVGRAISPRVAATVSVVLLFFGIAGGAGVFAFELWDEVRQSRLLFAGLADFEPAPLEPPRGIAEDPEGLLRDLRADALQWVGVASKDSSGLLVERLDSGTNVRSEAQSLPHVSAASGKPAAHFERLYGQPRGLDRGDGMPLVYRLTAPFYRSWPVAAGDVHGDGWTDVVLGSTHGPLLFANRRGERFTAQRIDVPALSDLYAANLALVDLNGDGWLDLFVSAYRGGNHVVYNDRGRFHAGGYARLPDHGASLAGAVGFGDIDRDGDLEIVLGNWTSGPFTMIPPEASRNAVLWNHGDGFEWERLPGTPGETLSTLVSDLNRDGRPDLAIGNDFSVPDMIYLQKESGLSEPLPGENDLIPGSSWYTMSVDSADVNNDLALDLYFGNISGRASSQAGRVPRLDEDEVCEHEYGDHAGWREHCVERMQRLGEMRAGVAAYDVDACRRLTNRETRGGCFAWLLLDRATRFARDPDLCDLFPAAWEGFAHLCRDSFRGAFESAAPPDTLRQNAIANVLLIAGEDGRYLDRAGELGVDVAGWTWNAKFADFDNDEWQDLYVVNGYVNSDWRESNLLFWNDAGRGFRDRSRAMGLESYLATSTYAAADFDGDGDLDLVSQTADGPVWLHRNRGGGNAVVIELRDRRANHFGVGSKVVIHYGPDGDRHQIREIKASGGFSSFEPPRAHFGLGEYRVVRRVEIDWSTGERDVFFGELEAGHRYRITRR